VSSLVIPRRKFLIGLGALVAAPAIVRASSLMPVKLMQWSDWHHYAVVRRGGAVKIYLDSQLLGAPENVPLIPKMIGKTLQFDGHGELFNVNIEGQLHGDFTASFWAKRGGSVG
jgi:hypothetical protein